MPLELILDTPDSERTLGSRGMGEVAKALPNEQ